MTTFSKSRVLLLGAAVSAIAIVQPSAPLMAQETDGEPRDIATDRSGEIIVTGTRYNPAISSAATKTAVSILETPQSINFVTRELIEDMGSQRLDEVGQRVSGIQQNGIYGGYYRQLNIRGFFVSNIASNKRDGFTYVKLYEPDISSVDRVEVIKGPSSVLYGRTVPGGFINLVSPMPKDEFGGSVTAKIGNYDYYRAEADIGGPLNESKTIRFRMTGAIQDTGSPVDFQFTNQEAANLYVTLNPSETTQIDVAAYYHDQRGLGAFGVGTTTDGELPDISRSLLASAPFDRINLKSYGIRGILTQNLSDQWRFVVRGDYSRSERFQPSAQFAFGQIGPAGTMELYAYREDQKWDVYSAEANIIGDIEAFDRNHTLIIGADHQTLSLLQGDNTSFFNGTLNVFNPDYDAIPFVVVPVDAYVRRKYKYSGLFAQAKIELTDRLSVVAGGRFDWAKEPTFSRPPITTKSDAFTWRAAAVYNFTKSIMAYGSYSESFEAAGAGQQPDGSPLPPSIGKQYEIGAKAALAGGRVIATVSLFDLEKSNISEAFPGGGGFQVPVGTQKHKGIEIDIVGEITRGWNLIAAYTYLDAEISDSTRPIVGNTPANLSDHVFSVFTTYEVPEGSLRGFGGGGGVYVISDRQGDTANTFELPGYAKFDAVLFYRGLENIEFSLNVNNVFNKRYWGGNVSGSRDWGLYLGEPRTVFGSIRYRF